MLTTKELIIAVADRMDDPDRVVIDPRHLYEDAAGRAVPRSRYVSPPCRACVAGHLDLLANDADQLSYTDADYLLSPVVGDFTRGNITAAEAAAEARRVAERL